MFAKACATGLEGIVSKKADAPYTAGRQKGWLKTKCAQRQEFIILGFSAARTGDRALGALYLGYRKDGALRYAGKVGTGFSMKSARDLAERFATLAVTKPVLTRAETGGMPAGEWQSIRWIKPVLLCEVAFTEWTQDGRIRHPSFQGLREDKDAGDVKKETPVPTRAVAKNTQAKEKAGALVVGGITITHPDRVISETGHVTKGELAEYYAAVAPFLLPRIARHPLSLLRCPSGIDGECFYQRNPGKGLGPDVHPFEFRHKGKKYEYLYIEDEKGLLEVIQMGAIEIHPWGAPIDAIDYPDRLIFDLDPAPDVPFEALKLAAQDLRQRLERKGLESTLKCTGGKGLHVTVPLAGKDKWPAVKSFAAVGGPGNGGCRSGSLCRHDEQGKTHGQDIHRLFPQRLYGHGHRRLCGPCAAGRARRHAARMERTQEPEIRQPVHDEGCPETPARQKAGLAETRTGYSFEMIRAWLGSLHDT